MLWIVDIAGGHSLRRSWELLFVDRAVSSRPVYSVQPSRSAFSSRLVYTITSADLLDTLRRPWLYPCLIPRAEVSETIPYFCIKCSLVLSSFSYPCCVWVDVFCVMCDQHGRYWELTELWLPICVSQQHAAWLANCLQEEARDVRY